MSVAALRRSVRALAIVAPAVAMIITAAPANAAMTMTAATPRVCLPVRLTGVGQDLGPDNQGQLHTTGTVFLGRFPIATTNATFSPSGPPAGSVLSFTGPIVFTRIFTASTLTANVQGTVDLSTGGFQATSTRVAGTGALADVSGSLTFRGTEDLTTGAFTETVRGRLCSPIHSR